MRREAMCRSHCSLFAFRVFMTSYVGYEGFVVTLITASAYIYCCSYDWRLRGGRKKKAAPNQGHFSLATVEEARRKANTCFNGLDSSTTI